MLAAAASAAAAGPGRHAVRGGQPPAWTNRAPKLAAVSATKGVGAKVWLAPRNAAQLATLAQAVSDPSNAQYGQFLTEPQYVSQFAPTAGQVAAVTQWLTGAGLHVDAVGSDNHYVAVSGTASAIKSAFGTPLALFQVNGKAEQAPTAPVTVPDSLANVVLAVTGLTTVGHKVTPNDLGAPPAFVNARPCSSYYGQQVASSLPRFQGRTLPYAVCGYTPDQLRGAYGIGAAAGPGTGSTVAITDAFDASTLRSDANTYATRHGDPAFNRRQFQDRSAPEPPASDPSVSDCGGNGWYGEQTLDVEAVHAMAPGANVSYYGAASCYDDDLLAALSQVVSDNQASIVTNSWGEPTYLVIDGVTYTTIDTGLVASYESIFEQGVVQGIGFYFSSGDDGDNLAAWGVTHPDWPEEDPWVTSVGGTSLAVGAHNERQFETGWGTQKYSLVSGGTWSDLGFLYGAGGGFTLFDGAPDFARPWYQIGTVPANTVGRAVPDIGMDADPTTGMLVGETQSFGAASIFGPAGVHYGEYRIGGTSLASPLMAGVQAVAQQGARGRFNRIGFANPLIYSLAHRPGVYFDVTPQGDPGNVRPDYVNGLNASGGVSYSVRTFDQDSSLTTGPGWDDVTGVGSVTARYVQQAGH